MPHSSKNSPNFRPDLDEEIQRDVVRTERRRAFLARTDAEEREARVPIRRRCILLSISLEEAYRYRQEMGWVINRGIFSNFQRQLTECRDASDPSQLSLKLQKLSQEISAQRLFSEAPPVQQAQETPPLNP